MKKKIANRPKLVAKATRLAIVKAGRRKNSSRSTGSRLRRSIATKASAARAEAASSSTIHQAPKPALSPSISAKVSAVIAAAPATRPGRSIERPAGSELSSSVRWAATSAVTPSARLNQKTSRQPEIATSRPPSTGPAASEMPETEVQIPSARARSRSSG